ncbi:MAG TPA: EpsI family protein [Terriglobia bacterium]
MRQSDSRVRSAAVLALLLATALLLHAHDRPEIVPPRTALSDFPSTIGPWHSVRNIPFTQETLDVLGPGEYLERIYMGGAGDQFVDLLLAYVPSQRTGDWIHSPKHCMPGAGWSPLVTDRIDLARPDDPPISVNRYVLGKGAERQIVLYWYQAHGRAVASEYWAKIYLVSDSIKLNRTDGSLVRVTTPVLDGEAIETAQKRAISFAEGILPYLDQYIPR